MRYDIYIYIYVVRQLRVNEKLKNLNRIILLLELKKMLLTKRVLRRSETIYDTIIVQHEYHTCDVSVVVWV